MELLITYSIKASLAMALFYCLHMLLFRNETFFKLRRAYFLFALVFSLVFPFISFSLESNTSTLPTAVYMLSEIEVFVDGQMQTNVTGGGIENVSIFYVLLGITSLGTLLFCGRFILQLVSLVNHLLNTNTRKIDGFRIIEIENGKCSSFSFFQWIVVNSSEQTESQLEDIVKHERVHASQWHSVDVLLYEVFCVIFWWNPFAWMMKNEMKLNLEYLADAGALQTKDDYKDYQYTLLKISTANSGTAFINNFNILHLKKRITMMNKKRSSFIRSAKFLLAAPLALALMLGNVVHATPSVVETVKATATENNSVEVDQTPKKETKVHDFVEVMPGYPGGYEKMMEFVSKNLVYPELAQQSGVEGRVVVRFVIQADGSVTDAKVMRGFGSEDDKGVIIVGYGEQKEEKTVAKGELIKLLNEEALRVINDMPKWTPGKHNGEAAAVYFNLPFVFRLKK